MHKFDDSWKYWIWRRVHRGDSKQHVGSILLEFGFAPELVQAELGVHLRQEASVTTTRERPLSFGTGESPPGPQALDSKKDQLPIDDNCLTKRDTSMVRQIHPGAQQLNTDKAELFVFDDFLNASECDELHSLIRTNLRPSTVGLNVVDHKLRTSKTCDLLGGHPLVDELNARICDYAGIEFERSEVLQGQLYEMNNEFKEHTDYFEPGTREHAQFSGARGQRTWTFMIYLTDVERGGETAFPKLSVHIVPKAGRAVFWNNLRPDGVTVNPFTLHCGRPVLGGSKCILTKWFREKSLMPASPPWRPWLSRCLPTFTPYGFALRRAPHELVMQLRAPTVPSSAEELQTKLSDTVLPLLSEWAHVDLSRDCDCYHRTCDAGKTSASSVMQTGTQYERQVLSAILQISSTSLMCIRDHHSRLHNIILHQGDILLYESARCAHTSPQCDPGESSTYVVLHAHPLFWLEHKTILHDALASNKMTQHTC